MTGDGVNDAPALEAAQVGIAMGQRGTDVAREAAHLVLLDDRFASIVAGVAMGRRIFANLRKALTYVVAIHVPIAGLALRPLLLRLPPAFFPMHVVLLELVIDPVCSVAFEAEPSERGAMERPPRPAAEPLFGTRELALGLIQGAVILLATLGLYALALDRGAAEAEAFSGLVAANLALAFADSAEPGTRFLARHGRVFVAIAAGAATLAAPILAWPPLAGVFGVTWPGLAPAAGAVALGVAAEAWFGLLRLGLAARAG